MKLEDFNQATRAKARALLLPCVDIYRWADAVAAARPYSAVDEALEVARRAADPWTDTEVNGALAHHPRIGQRAAGATAEASMSRREQAIIDPSDEWLTQALADGNRHYEEKFGHVFLIRAAGRSSADILEALQERLEHTPEQEKVIMAQQLREIAVLRLEGALSK